MPPFEPECLNVSAGGLTCPEANRQSGNHRSAGFRRPVLVRVTGVMTGEHGENFVGSWLMGGWGFFTTQLVSATGMPLRNQQTEKRSSEAVSR